jgi:hypothetical protein
LVMPSGVFMTSACTSWKSVILARLAKHSLSVSDVTDNYDRRGFHVRQLDRFDDEFDFCSHHFKRGAFGWEAVTTSFAKMAYSFLYRSCTTGVTADEVVQFSLECKGLPLHESFMESLKVAGWKPHESDFSFKLVAPLSVSTPVESPSSY